MRGVAGMSRQTRQDITEMLRTRKITDKTIKTLVGLSEHEAQSYGLIPVIQQLNHRDYAKMRPWMVWLDVPEWLYYYMSAVTMLLADSNEVNTDGLKWDEAQGLTYHEIYRQYDYQKVLTMNYKNNKYNDTKQEVIVKAFINNYIGLYDDVIDVPTYLYDMFDIIMEHTHRKILLSQYREIQDNYFKLYKVNDTRTVESFTRFAQRIHKEPLYRVHIILQDKLSQD